MLAVHQFSTPCLLLLESSCHPHRVFISLVHSDTKSLLLEVSLPIIKVSCRISQSLRQACIKKKNKPSENGSSLSVPIS